jgi:polyadenylate-binding protein
LVVQATDEFIDSLLDQTVLVQKQKLGDKLYKVVKSFGLKGAVSVFPPCSNVKSTDGTSVE